MQAEKTSGVTPDQITTDKEPALYPAMENVFGDGVRHRDSKFMNNRIESDHRVTKSRLSIMKGFKDIFCALKFCTVFEEVRQFFRMKNKTRSERRSLLTSRIQGFQNLSMIAA